MTKAYYVFSTEGGHAMEEKRRHKRIERSFMSWFRTVSFVLIGRCFSKWDMVTVRNLSASGMLFCYDDTITKGTQVNFKIIFPFSAHVIRCIGRIIRNNKPQEDSYPKISFIAAEFEKIKKEDKHLINEIANKAC